MHSAGYWASENPKITNGKPPYERRFGEPFKRPIIPFGAVVQSSNLQEKVLPAIFLGYERIAGGIWKGYILIADLEELEILDASYIYPRRLKRQRSVDHTQKDDEFIFPVADGTAELSGRDCEFRVPTLKWETSVRSEDLSGELQGKPGESQPAETTDDAEAPCRLLVDSR